ncbi:ABC transporter ATP-binding protein [Streptomyces sp. NPDC048142]|uniref:ABC transporter ATP-binding protein n=1 Tax=Streptomyces sp. NPDC048142 TaxID=3365501 RepID=UPI003723792E
MPTPHVPGSPPAAGGPSPGLFLLLRGRLRPCGGLIAVACVLQLLQSLALLALPTLTAGIVDCGIVAQDTGYIVGHGGIMLAIAAVQAACSAGAVYLGARVAMNLGADLRSAVFTHVQRFTTREIGHFGAPSLLTRTTNDVQQVQTLAFMALTLLVTAPLMGVGGIALAVEQDVPMSAVLLVAVPAMVAVIGFLIVRLVGPSRVMQRRIDAVNRVMREQIAGMRVIRAFTRDAHEQRRFQGANADLTAVALRVGRIQAYFGASAGLISQLASIAVVSVGAWRVADGDLQLGSLVAFLNYLALILTAVMMAMGVFMSAPRAKVCAGRISEVLATEPGITEPSAPTGPQLAEGCLELRHVTFRHPGAERPVLRGLDLVALPGRTTAVIGSTGGGKSTLVHLAARLLDADSGTVSIDGIDVRHMDRRTLSAAVALVPQRAYLFSGTIASNLRYGDPTADDDELWHVLEVAQARDFVAALPDGLDTAVGQGGSTLSGGQRQRLAIARALIARPRLYLFDDAFSALDNATDAALRAALADEIGDATQVVVSQRVSTIRTADRIAVLDGGRIEAFGTHEELLDLSPVYAEIADSQRALQETT